MEAYVHLFVPPCCNVKIQVQCDIVTWKLVRLHLFETPCRPNIQILHSLPMWEIILCNVKIQVQSDIVRWKYVGLHFSMPPYRPNIQIIQSPQEIFYVM